MEDDEKVYYESPYVVVKRSQIVIQPYTGRPAWLDWLLGHPGEQTVAMRSVIGIETAKPSKVRPVLVILIGLLLSFFVIGIPIVILGLVWLVHVNRFGTIVMILTGAGPINMYESEGRESIVRAVQDAFADRG